MKVSNENLKEMLTCIDTMLSECTENFFTFEMEEEQSSSDLFSANASIDHNRSVENDSKQSKKSMEERIKVLEQIHKVLEELNNSVSELPSLEKSEKVRYSILDVLELDRKCIARDLHDSSVQVLTMLVHKTELCEKLIELDTIRTKMELHLMGEILKDSISELRQTIYNLRPMSMDDLGLMDSIERHIQVLLQNSEILFRLKVVNEEQIDIEAILQPVQKLSIFRVIQECCSNIIKHSKATKALITLHVKHNMIKLIIQDNGVGFKNKQDCETSIHRLTHMNNNSGFGLSMLCERIYLLNGTINIDSDNDGTAISICIPLLTKEEENNETN